MHAREKKYIKNELDVKRVESVICGGRVRRRPSTQWQFPERPVKMSYDLPIEP